MQPLIGFSTVPGSERDRRPYHGIRQEGVSDALSVRLDVSIQADTRRLFHALTDPEYQEAWLTLPGHHRGCSTIARRYDEDYLIEHFCDGGRQCILISGRYLIRRRHHAIFSWRVDRDIYVPETEVEIHLRGDFERTGLILRHSGFSSRRDSAWHWDLWNASISSLAGLYAKSDRPRSIPDRDRERIRQPRSDPHFQEARRRILDS